MSSRRRGRNLIIVQTTSEWASIGIGEVRKTRTPRPAKTVIAPKARGIKAARAERKTRRRTSSRRGREELCELGGGERFVLKCAGDAGEAGLGRSPGRVDLGVEGVLEAWHRLAHRLG